MNYICLSIITHSQENSEILMALLSELGFESFEENANELRAYSTEDLYDEQITKKLLGEHSHLFLEYTKTRIEKQNWNAVWEKNYEPVFVKDQCVVYASFHVIKKKYPYSILINPKMSFGTGHHATTALMMESILELDFQNKTVLDIGCGTGILAILAGLKKAKNIKGFDIEDWAVENALENCQLNSIKATIWKGTIQTQTLNEEFDIIFANINRHVLVAEISIYTNHLTPNGILLVSGFYEEDVEIIKEIARQAGLKFISQKTKNSWVAIRFDK